MFHVIDISFYLCKSQLSPSTLFTEKFINIVYRNTETKKTNNLARDKQYLILFSDQSSQRAFKLVTVMCRYKLMLAAC